MAVVNASAITTNPTSVADSSAGADTARGVHTSRIARTGTGVQCQPPERDVTHLG